MALAPDSADVMGQMARIQRWSCRLALAQQTIRRAIALAPAHPPWFTAVLGAIHLFLGRFEEAIPIEKQAIERVPDSIWPHIFLAATYAALERAEEAHAEAREVLRIEPRFVLEEWAPHALPLKEEAFYQRMVERLRAAGLP